MITITSTQNQIIKTVALLHNSSERKKSKLICAEGIKLTNELIRSGYQIKYCFVRDDHDLNLLPNCISNDKIIIVSSNVMNRISSLKTPQGVLTVAHEKSYNDNMADEKFILALDTIQDPNNLGAIIRSAEAFGVKTVVISEGCCDCYSSKVIRSSMGSILRLKILSVSLPEFLDIAKDGGYRIIGTGLDKNFKTVDKLHESLKKVVVIGNEGNGITDAVKQKCDFGMFIPMYGENESLNAAVAASIIMWENIRQENE